MPKTLAIIQARISSTRLPGKVLHDIAGQPMLARVIERTCKARSLEGVVVATTVDAVDDPIQRLCSERGYPCYRGSSQDVLDRYYQAARACGAEVIVRITGDCPVMDAEVIDATVGEFSKDDGTGFAATRLPPPWRRTIPIGLDVEVVSFASLERAWQEADQPFHREHVMPFFYEGTPPDLDARGCMHSSPGPWYVLRGTSLRGFKVVVLNHDPDFGTLRWTVDTPDDLRLIREIYAHFPGREDFTWREILDLFARHPELSEINSEVKHKDFRESEAVLRSGEKPHD